MEAIRKELEQHINSTEGVSQSSVARSLGMSRPTINRYLQDKYEEDGGNVMALEEKICRYLELWELKKRQIGSFQMTSVADELTGALKYCRINNDMGVAWGFPGNGKTVTVENYSAENPDTIVITAGPEIRRDDIMLAICNHLMVTKYRSKYETMRALLDHLKHNYHYIIVDEAQFLPRESLEIVRKIHDVTQNPVFFVGQPVLKTELKGRYQKKVFAQIASRIGVWVDLSPANKADIEMICKNHDITDHSMIEYLYKQMLKPGNSLRTVVKFIKFAKNSAEIHGDAKITLNLLKDTARYLILE